MGPTQNTKNTRSRPDRAEWEREAMESKGLENTMHNMKPRTLGPTGYGESDWELMCFFLLLLFYSLAFSYRWCLLMKWLFVDPSYPQFVMQDGMV